MKKKIAAMVAAAMKQIQEKIGFFEYWFSTFVPLSMNELVQNPKIYGQPQGS